MLAFLVFFLVLLVIGVELQGDPGAGGGVLLFKKGKAPQSIEDAALSKTTKTDEEQIDAGAQADEVEREQDQAAQTLEASQDVFTFKYICYTVQIKSKSRLLLDYVSGLVKPGALTALMGSAGAGKTTLLNVLAQRAGAGIVEGEMLVNGRPLPTSFQRQTAYAQQQDIHMATQTVREALQFSALLRQPASVSRADKLAYVEDVRMSRCKPH